MKRALLALALMFLAAPAHAELKAVSSSGGSAAPFSGSAYALFGMPVTRGDYYTAEGDSITVGSLATFTTQGYAYLLAADLDANLTNRGFSGAQICDIADLETFPNDNPGPAHASVYTLLSETNDANNKGVGSYEAVAKACHQAVLSWNAIPSTFKTLASAATYAGTWVAGSDGYVGSPQVSTTNGSTVTFPFTTYGGVGICWFRNVDSNGGTFSVALDGGSPTNYSTATTPAIATGNSGIFGVTPIYFPGIAAGSHNAVFTVTSATSASNVIEPIACGTPAPYPFFETTRVFTGGVLRQTNDANAAATAAYDADTLADQQLLSGYGLPVYFVALRNYVNATTDMSSGLHPNTTGHIKIRNAFEGVMQPTLGGIFWDTVAHNFSIGPTNFQSTINFSAGGSNGLANLAIGPGALNANTTGNSNVALGYNSLQVNTTGSSNIAIGANVLALNTTGISNTSVGAGSMPVSTTGSSNTAFGQTALAANTTGGNNTAIGVSALTANTTGAANTAVGLQALKSNVTGVDNTAVGNGAATGVTGNSNTIVGYEALFTGAAGTGSNTSVGAVSLDADSSGTSNTAVGFAAAFHNTSGNQNTVIGQSVGSVTMSTGNSNILIGTSNSCDVTTGSSANETHICGTAGDSLKITGTNTVGTEAFTLNGVATLTTTGSGVTLTLTNGLGSCTHTPGSSSETVSCSSDLKFKKNIRNASLFSGWLWDFVVRQYDLRANGEHVNAGVVAQELLKTHPEMVHTVEVKDGEGNVTDEFFTVDEPNPWRLVKAIQELQMFALGCFLIALFSSLLHIVHFCRYRKHRDEK